MAGLTLNLNLADTQPDPNAPLTWLLTTLFIRVAPTFIVIAASAPMLQYWFASTNHPNAHNPYQLYAASNVGSMAALLGYPALIEPTFGLTSQRWLFSATYALLIALIAACAFATTKLGPAPTQQGPRLTQKSPITARQRLTWVMLAAIPSSLMLGVTQYITTDLASVPLLWVLPLAAYLATFIAVFAARPHLFPTALQPALILAVPFGLALASSEVDFMLSAFFHLALFAALTWSLHSQLADRKPEPAHLTEYFLWLSIGGAIGGLLNAAIAPLLLKYAIDYQLMLVAAVLALTWPNRQKDELRLDPWKLILPPLIFAIGLWMTYEVGFLVLNRGTSLAPVAAALLAAAAAAFIRPPSLKVTAVALIAIATFEAADTRGLVAADRSFFGAYKVFDRESVNGPLRRFSHGTTTHGAQFLDHKQGLPTAYHHPAGPVGQILGAIPHQKVAVIGLGAGAMAAYASPKHPFHFVEIDPLVESIARQHFTYLKNCGPACTVTIDDGRRELARHKYTYDIVFLDAYNSDSVPMHLLTREAHQVYRASTTPNGLVVYHVSNRYLDIASAVGAIAQDTGEFCWVQLHRPSKELQRNERVMPSMYAVVAKHPQDLEPLGETGTWTPCPSLKNVWTDDYGSILEVLK